MPFVSIIIPAFNAEETIRDALSSVRAQTFSDYEIIVVDDGSGDRTEEQVRCFLEDSRWCDNVRSMGAGNVTLIRQPANSGPAAARNRGVAEARGEWIAFLDADDVWLPDRLQIQIDCLRKDPAAVMWCGQTVEFGDNEQAYPPGKGEITFGGESSETAFSFVSLEDFIAENPVATSTVLVRRNAVLSSGGFDERFRGPEDFDLWMRIAAQFRIVKIKRPLACYRKVVGSLSMNDQKFLPQVLSVINKACGVNGVFQGRVPAVRISMLSNQYWHASWMAFCRGSRFDAVKYLALSFRCHVAAKVRVRRPWVRLLLRYCFGSNITA